MRFFVVKIKDVFKLKYVSTIHSMYSKRLYNGYTMYCPLNNKITDARNNLQELGIQFDEFKINDDDYCDRYLENIKYGD